MAVHFWPVEVWKDLLIGWMLSFRCKLFRSAVGSKMMRLAVLMLFAVSIRAGNIEYDGPMSEDDVSDLFSPPFTSSDGVQCWYAHCVSEGSVQTASLQVAVYQVQEFRFGWANGSTRIFLEWCQIQLRHQSRVQRWSDYMEQ